MSQLELFGPEDDRPAFARRLAEKLKRLAGRGIYFGTSSWKYPGWVGSIYSEKRYITRGKFSQKKFDEDCLDEYARTFPVVGGDFSFYQFPTPDYWARLFGNSPEELLFALKVPEELTVVTWPKHARYGPRAGGKNEGFLDPSLLLRSFVKPLTRHRGRVAALMFEFGTIPKSAIAGAEEFLARLEPFLAALPEGFRYSVEIRNPEYLGPHYFELLGKYNVSHVFNAWTRMPELSDQAEMEGALGADFVVSRALLQRGRSYDDAVQEFQPYESLKQPCPSARLGLRRLAEQAIRLERSAFLLVNNRLEGFAPGTIEAVADELIEALDAAPGGA